MSRLCWIRKQAKSCALPFPSGLQKLCSTLQDIYGLQETDKLTVALDNFFTFQRGSLTIQEIDVEFNARCMSQYQHVRTLILKISRSNNRERESLAHENNFTQKELDHYYQDGDRGL